MPVLKNTKHELFAQGLAKGMSADAAYEAAGYKPNRQAASRLLLTNVDVKARVDELVGKAAEKTSITIERVLVELGRLGFSDIRNALDQNGNLYPPSEWSDDFAAAVSSLEVVAKPTVGDNGEKTVEHIHKIKVWDKNSALEKLCKHLGMFAPEKHEVTGKDGEPLNPDSIEFARQVAFVLASGQNA